MRGGLMFILAMLFSATALGGEGLLAGNQAKSRHPHALLGSDFGVLSEDDLASQECVASPRPFSGSSRFSSYPYWQCFPTGTIRFLCEEMDPAERGGERTVILAVIASGVLGRQEYLSRAVMPLADCRRYRSDWLRISTGEEHACLSGSFNEPTKDARGIPVSYWTFDKVKTRRGCVSYFEGRCDLRHWIKLGCKSGT